MKQKQFMQLAIDLAAENVKTNSGGPFGAVIVKNGKIIATGVNKVTSNNDPTAHAEVSAIRNACENLKDFDLTGCDIYSSCEPCPMCLGAIYWSHIDHLYYAVNQKDAADSGFDDSFIYKEFSKAPSERRLASSIIELDDKLLPFKLWNEQDSSIKY